MRKLKHYYLTDGDEIPWSIKEGNGERVLGIRDRGWRDILIRIVHAEAAGTNLHVWAEIFEPEE